MANPVFESLDQAPLIQKVIIIAAILIVPLYFFANYSYFPNKNKIGVLEKDIAKLQDISNRLSIVKKDLERHKKEFKILSKSLPDKKEIPDLINRIVSLAHKNGIAVNRFNPSVVVNKKKSYNTVNIDLNLISDYRSLGQFITDLSSQKRIIVPGRIVIKDAKTKSKNSVKAHISLRLSTYYFKKAKR